MTLLAATASTDINESQEYRNKSMNNKNEINILFPSINDLTIFLSSSHDTSQNFPLKPAGHVHSPETNRSNIEMILF